MKRERTNPIIILFFVIFGIACFIPFLIVVSASLSSELDLSRYGFSVLPKKVDWTAYAYLFENPKTIIDAYKITIITTAVGTALSIVVMSMAAFCLARIDTRIKKILTAYIFFPTLFSGGMVSSYIINTQYLHLTDKIAVMILPSLINIFHIFMLRTFFQQLPDGLFEAAKIDGASEFLIYLKIAIPLSKPVIATVAFLGAMTRWNQWQLSMLYIRSSEKVSLQYLLQKMMRNIQELLDAMERAPGMVDINEIPGENLRMAMLVAAIGPMMFVFPFFQKYFTRGMTVGAVKG